MFYLDIWQKERGTPFPMTIVKSMVVPQLDWEIYLPEGRYYVSEQPKLVHMDGHSHQMLDAIDNVGMRSLNVIRIVVSRIDKSGDM